MKIKKLIAMGLAAIMAVSAMSISAFAAYDSTADFNELIATSYSVDEDGNITLNYPEVYNPLGQSTPPSNIAGNSTKYYLFDPVLGVSHNDNVYTNYDADFSFDFNTSCTTNTKQYAEFIVGGPNYANKQPVYLHITGKSTSTNQTEYVNVKLINTGSGDDINVGKVAVARGGENIVAVNSLLKNQLYYVLVTPYSTSAGHAIHADVTINRLAY